MLLFTLIVFFAEVTVRLSTLIVFYAVETVRLSTLIVFYAVETVRLSTLIVFFAVVTGRLSVLCLLHTVTLVDLLCVIVVFPGHTHLLKAFRKVLHHSRMESWLGCM